ncbi:MAG: hypothetical protein JKY93_00750 [Gammaproteobacteria bacterium]|nr:hypothetical protein [Gammaproteobacteria bacterium]
MTTIYEPHLRELVIQPALKALGLYSLAAENLLVGTAKHESGGGRYLAQINGPALGIYQIEPATHRDIFENFLAYRPDLAAHVIDLAAYVAVAMHPLINGLVADHIMQLLDEQLITNLLYSTAIARLVYYRDSHALPAADDLPALAAYYKRVFNTVSGKASEQDFIHTYYA